ncbi:MAG: hypothetical protein ABGX38_01635, partial [Thermoleophilia bacterium]
MADPANGGTAAQVVPLIAARALDRALDYSVPEALEGAAIPGALVAVRLGPRAVLGVVVGREAPTHSGALAPIAGVVDAPAVSAELLALARWVAGRTLAPLGACLKLVLPPGAEGALRRSPDGSWRLGAPTGRGRARLVARMGDPDAAAAATGRRAAVLAELGTAGGTLPAADLVRLAGTTMPTLRRMADEGVIHLRRERPDASGLDWFGPAPSPDAPPDLTGEQQHAVERIARAVRSPEADALLLHGVTASGKTEVYLRA